MRGRTDYFGLQFKKFWFGTISLHYGRVHDLHERVLKAHVAAFAFAAPHSAAASTAAAFVFLSRFRELTEPSTNTPARLNAPEAVGVRGTHCEAGRGLAEEFEEL